MVKTVNKTVGELTVQDFQDIVRKIVREEMSSNWRIDNEGNIIFLFEEDYIDYISKRKEESSLEINAFFIDDQGFTVRYTDEELTAKAKKRIEKAKMEIAKGKGINLEEIKQRLKAN